MLKGNECRALMLVALAFFGLSGCGALAPEREPEVVSTDDGAREGSEAEASTREEAAPEEQEEQQDSDEREKAREEARPSLTERREQLSEPAPLDSPTAIGEALGVFYHLRPMAFMAPVTRHVQGAFDLGGVEGDRETRRCPSGGVFQLEWQGDVDARSGSRELLYRFKDCRGRFGDGPLLVLNGDYRRDFEPLAGSEQVIETFDIHGFMGEGDEREPVALKGEQRIERPAEGGVVRRTDRMELLMGDTYMAFEGVRDAITPEAGDSDSEFASFDTRFMTTLEGRLVSSELGGWVDLTTDKPLMEQQAPCSASGIVTLAGGRKGEVRFGPDTGTHHRVALEMDGGEVERYDRCSSFGEALGLER